MTARDVGEEHEGRAERTGTQMSTRGVSEG